MSSGDQVAVQPGLSNRCTAAGCSPGSAAGSRARSAIQGSSQSAENHQAHVVLLGSTTHVPADGFENGLPGGLGRPVAVGDELPQAVDREAMPSGSMASLMPSVYMTSDSPGSRVNVTC